MSSRRKLTKARWICKVCFTWNDFGGYWIRGVCTYTDSSGRGVPREAIPRDQIGGIVGEPTNDSGAFAKMFHVERIMRECRRADEIVI